MPIFEAQNPGVNVQLINFGGTMHDKLLAAMLSNFGAPDLVEVEITSIGRFLKGAIDEVGFVDLRPRLENEGGWRSWSSVDSHPGPTAVEFSAFPTIYIRSSCSTR